MTSFSAVRAQQIEPSSINHPTLEIHQRTKSNTGLRTISNLSSLHSDDQPITKSNSFVVEIKNND